MTPSLSDEINAIIRSEHTTLNQLILRLLPSALPPCTSTPRVYAHGIAHFLPIYCAFEIPLRSLHALAPPYGHGHGIYRLYIPALERSPSLEHDVKYFMRWPDANLLEYSPLRRTIAEGVGSEHGPRMDDRPRLSRFVNHISATVVSKPHVLLAYTWIFYMALFQGGRYIRSKLRGVEANSFWVRDLNPKRANESVTGSIPLSFWEFPTATRDGEDLKTEFKARFRDIEPSLSMEEKTDILQEAVEIMTQLLEVVREIDMLSQEENAIDDEKSPVPSMMLSNKKFHEVDEASEKEERTFITKLFHLSMSAATEALIRFRSFVSFAPREPLPVSVSVNRNFNE